MRAFVTSGKSAPYFNNLVWFIQSKSEELQGLVRQLQAGPGSGQTNHRFRDCVDELSDLLYYIQDIYALAVPELSVAMSSNLLDKLAHFVEALSPAPAAGLLQPAISLYVLGQLFFVLREPNLVQALAALLLSDRSPLLSLLATPGCTMPAVFLLLCLARSSAAPALLGASLARQSSLLQAILSPDASVSVSSAVPAGEQDNALVAGLLGVLSMHVPVRALQCTVLLLRAVQGASSSLGRDSPAHLAYVLAGAPLRAQLAASPAAALETFERGLASYRQINFGKLAQEPESLLLPSSPHADEAVHRFLVLRDLLTGQREALLPLQPASVPLSAAGSRVSVALGSGGVLLWREVGGKRVLAVHATHLCVMEGCSSAEEEEEAAGAAAALPPAMSAVAVASMALQHVDVKYVREDGSWSHSLPSASLKLDDGELGAGGRGGGAVTLTLASVELAQEARAAMLSRRNAIVDGKLRQLSELLHDDRLHDPK